MELSCTVTALPRHFLAFGRLPDGTVDDKQVHCVYPELCRTRHRDDVLEAPLAKEDKFRAIRAVLLQAGPTDPRRVLQPNLSYQQVRLSEFFKALVGDCHQ